MVNVFKKLLPHSFRQRIKRKLFKVQDMQARLENLKRAGFYANGAIDGGAYQGEWTQMFWSVWPSSPCLMIEPQPSQYARLSQLALKVPGSAVRQVAIADVEGTDRFHLDQSNSRLATRDSDGAIDVDVRTIDNVLNELPNFRPNLLKLDLQGGELVALSGCRDRLRQFELIVLEVSIIRIGEVPILCEVDQYMTERGYRVYDLLPAYFRPRDGALWQIDAFYVQESSPLVASREWA